MGISFLQPLLIPVAVAAILAFLLEPLVRFFIRLRLSRLLSILIVYIAATGLLVGLLVYILPPAYRQGTTLVKNFPQYLQKTEALSIRRSITSNTSRKSSFSERTAPFKRQATKCR